MLQNKYQRVVPRIMVILLSFLLPVHALVHAQEDSAYAFIVAGHAYGAHSGGNTGLHPSLLKRLNSGYDATTSFIVFTGDIVNESTPESWQQVETELAQYGLPSYYVMGNHDNNDAGRQVFEAKHGGTWYSFIRQSSLFIVLNSTESGRSISTGQLKFLEEQINQAGDSLRNIFIFFHEILWNSHEKYIDVRSNSRSRYDQIVDYSNYWEKVHPLLTAKPTIHFFVIAGDVGGNPDAVAAFYDTWSNVTLLASGMGEVPDENYLLIHMHSQDSVAFELVPLDATLSIPPIEYHSVPLAPEAITGPAAVLPGSSHIEYYVPEVFNATSYLWELPEGASGTGTANSISIDFDTGFTGDTLSVQAARDGFGSSPPLSLFIAAQQIPNTVPEGSIGPPRVGLQDQGDHLIIALSGHGTNTCVIRLYDCGGKLIKSETVRIPGEYTEVQLDKLDTGKGIFFISVASRSLQSIRKIAIR